MRHLHDAIQILPKYKDKLHFDNLIGNPADAAWFLYQNMMYHVINFDYIYI